MNQRAEHYQLKCLNAPVAVVPHLNDWTKHSHEAITERHQLFHLTERQAVSTHISVFAASYYSISVINAQVWQGLHVVVSWKKCGWPGTERRRHMHGMQRSALLEIREFAGCGRFCSPCAFCDSELAPCADRPKASRDYSLGSPDGF